MTTANTFIHYRGKEDGYVVYVSGQFVGARPNHQAATDLRNTETMKRIKAETKAVRP